MIQVTELMNRVFSETEPELNEKLAEKIEEAKKTGNAELKDGKNQLELKKDGNDVVIKDITNNEITVAKENSDGSSTLQAETKTHSATEPDVIVEKPVPGETILDEGSTEPSVIVDVVPSITDKDKAGVGKHFSLVFSGFENEDDAVQFFSDNFEDTLTFSDDEVEQICYSMNELNGTYERLLGTEDASLAFSVIDAAEDIKSYSVLAENYGHDMSDVIDACNFYSEEADNMLYSITAETDVNDFFSELDEYEAEAYFSELDEYEAAVVFSALESGEPMTFSEAEEAAEELKEEAALNEEISDAVQSFSDEEFNEFFSELTDQEMDVLFSVLEENPNATFSDINDAFDMLYTPVTEYFSDMTESEYEEAMASYSDDELFVLDQMFSDDEEVYTFSDFLDVMEEVHSFSDSDVEVLANNATELDKAAADLAENGDVELAAKVKVVSDEVAEQAKKAAEAGHDTEAVINACAQYSEDAAVILENNGIDPDDIDASNTNVYADEDDEDDQKAECDSCYSDYDYSEDMRFFGDTSSSVSSVNPYLTSPIN